MLINWFHWFSVTDPPVFAAVETIETRFLRAGVKVWYLPFKTHWQKGKHDEFGYIIVIDF